MGKPNWTMIHRAIFAKDSKVDEGVDGEFSWQRASLRDLSSKLLLTTGEMMFTGKGDANLEVFQQQLASRQLLVNRWILPVLHGALGAMIFCLVRVLNTSFIVPITQREVVLRLFFGAFVGYLTSALLLPAGMLGVQVTGPAPLASLGAFIFGYSMDSFWQCLTGSTTISLHHRPAMTRRSDRPFAGGSGGAILADRLSTRASERGPGLGDQSTRKSTGALSKLP